MGRDYIRSRSLSCRVKVVGRVIRNDIKYESQTPSGRHALRVSDGVTMNSALRRLQAATVELTKGTALKQRLTVAFSGYLKELDPSELRLELRGECRAILEELESVPPLRGESAVQATVRKMSAEQADDIARRIVHLFAECALAPEPELHEAEVLDWHVHRDGREPSEARFSERADAETGPALLYAAEA